MLTVDAMVDGIHFDDRLSPSDVGFKLVASNVSDLAAMGAAPRWGLLTLGLPAPDEAWVRGVAEGLHEACARWEVDLVGGDTVRSPNRFLSLQPRRRPRGRADHARRRL